MQKFILLRGHQGSGKSTFATEKIAQFQRDYPDAEIIHIENDLLLTDEQGIYHFDSKKLSEAQRIGMDMMRQALMQGQNHPQRNILIINSNTNQKTKACETLLDLADKYHFETEVYRLHNFYPNLHAVDERAVLEAYQRLNQQPVHGEIHVPAVRPISTQQRAMLDKLNINDVF